MGTALLSPLFLAGIAQAQEANKNPDDDIVIHIDHSYDDVSDARRIVIDDKDLVDYNTINLEDNLNTLPMVIPGMTAFSNDPGDGTASVDLRGLGAERTLVLVNGQRFVGTGGEGRIDLNAIPAALVKKIVIDTNIGSAIYGSGAIAGIVNIRLDDDFTGNEIGASYELSEHGDGGESSAYLKLGRSFDNDRGQAMIFASYNKREGVFAGERDFSSQTNNDTGTGFEAFGSSGVPGTRLFDNFDFTNAGYTTDGTTCTPPASGSVEGLSGTCTGGATFDANGNIIPWINTGTNTTRYNYAPPSYLQIPQDRYSLAAFGRYDITDSIDLKLSSIFTSNKVPTQLAPTPFFSTVTIDLNTNPFLNAATRSTVMASAIAGGQSTNAYQVFIGRRMIEAGPRRVEREKQNLHLSADFAGYLSDNWSWDIHGHYSRETLDTEKSGNISISAMRAAVFSGQCDIFGADAFSDVCVDMVSRTTVEETTSAQYNINGTIDGDVDFLQSPRAENPMQILLGAEYRADKFDYRPDSVLGPDVAGFNQELPIAGTRDSYEVYGEFYWPLIEEQPGFEELSAIGAVRYSRINAGTATSENSQMSYLFGLDWAPVSSVVFNTQFNGSFRQPSIVELFAPRTNGFPGGVDPCSMQLTGAQAYGDRDICIANGVPAFLYNTPLPVGAQLQALFGGNPDLQTETSDTFTAGVSITPDGNADIEFSAYYIQTKIDNAIGTLPVQLILDGCYVGGELSYCDRVNRRPTSGGILFVDVTSGNFLSKKMEAMDFAFRSAFDMLSLTTKQSSADLEISVLASLQLNNSNSHPSIDIVNQPSTLQQNFFDCAGYNKSQVGFCGEPLPKWKHTASAKYTDGDWSLTARWRYSSSTQIDNLNPDAPVRNTPFSRKFASETGAVHYIDLSGQWDINEVMNISAGVINLFDQSPPVFGDCCSQQANTFPSSYDPIGRKFFVTARANF